MCTKVYQSVLGEQQCTKVTKVYQSVLRCIKVQNYIQDIFESSPYQQSLVSLPVTKKMGISTDLYQVDEFISHASRSDYYAALRRFFA